MATLATFSLGVTRCHGSEADFQVVAQVKPSGAGQDPEHRRQGQEPTVELEGEASRAVAEVDVVVHAQALPR